MKKLLAVFSLLALVACNDSADADNELDTLEQKLERGWDSTKAEVKEIRDTLEKRWENRKDSTMRDSADRN